MPVSRLAFKITTPEDLELAEAILRSRGKGMLPMTQRVGIGFDAHPFAAGRPLRLGGVEVPHAAGLEGHSDGDALLHALTDAVLGAAGLGSIGDHFSPTRSGLEGRRQRGVPPQGVRSRRGERPGNRQRGRDRGRGSPEDRPPRAARIRERIAAILGVEAGRVSVRGTSSNGLGFTGQKEGIAAMAVVLLTPR